MLPGEDARMCLMQHFTPFFTCVLEALYPHKAATATSSMLSSGWPRMHCRLGSNCQSFWDVVDEQWKPEGQEQLTTMMNLHMIGQVPDA